jgi:hypothetical protein
MSTARGEALRAASRAQTYYMEFFAGCLIFEFLPVFS